MTICTMTPATMMRAPFSASSLVSALAAEPPPASAQYERSLCQRLMPAEEAGTLFMGNQERTDGLNDERGHVSANEDDQVRPVRQAAELRAEVLDDAPEHDVPAGGQEGR